MRNKSLESEVSKLCLHVVPGAVRSIPALARGARLGRGAGSRNVLQSCLDPRAELQLHLSSGKPGALFDNLGFEGF